MDPVQETEEQRRITQRGQGTTDIADEEDEEHEDMRLVPAILVGADQRTDQQHRGARRAEQARRHRTEAEDHEVGERCAQEVAGDPDATRNDEEREQEQDERHVFMRGRLEQGVGRRRETPRQCERGDEKERPGGRHGPEIALPPLSGEQRKGRDRQQKARKWQVPDEREVVRGVRHGHE